MECAGAGGSAPCVLSAANEAAVAAFLGKKIGYHRIYELVDGAVSALAEGGHPDLEEILRKDRAAREYVNREIG